MREIYNFGPMPTSMACVTSPYNLDIFLDLKIGINDSGLLQVISIPDPTDVYDCWHSDAPGKVWENLNTHLYNHIFDQEYKNVVEVGGGKYSIFAKKALLDNKAISWTNCDPFASPQPDLKGYIANPFFIENTDIQECDLIIHSNLIEHLIDPLSFFQKLRTKLKTGTNHRFSAPNMMESLNIGNTSFLNFEHTIFLPEDYIDHILHLSGFKILNKTYHKNFMIFYDTVCSEPQNSTYNPIVDLDKIFIDYIQKHKNKIEYINKELQSVPDNFNIIYFGAHIFYLIDRSLGLNTEKIHSFIDNSLVKQGKRLRGTSMTVSNPLVIKSYDNVCVIINNIFYKQEMIEQIKLIKEDALIIST